jgi:hypothetical protein
MPQRFIQDADLVRSPGLPVGDTTTYTADIDLGQGEKFEDVELEVRIPLLALSELPDGTSITAKVYHGDAAGPTDELTTLGSVTGATGTDPSEPKTFRYRFPPDVKRYVRVGFTGEATVDADAKAATVSLIF